MLREWLLDFDELSLAKLTKIALRIRDGDPFKNIEEACYAGSPAARLLIEHGVVTKERDRADALKEAKRRQEAAAKEVVELSR